MTINQAMLQISYIFTRITEPTSTAPGLMAQDRKEGQESHAERTVEGSVAAQDGGAEGFFSFRSFKIHDNNNALQSYVQIIA